MWAVGICISILAVNVMLFAVVITLNRIAVVLETFLEEAKKDFKDTRTF